MSDPERNPGADTLEETISPLNTSNKTGGYLGDPSVVRSYVQDFVGQIVADLEAVHDGNMTEAQAKENAEALCDRAGKVFSGGDDEYTTMPAWSKGQIGYFIRQHYPTEVFAKIPAGNPAPVIAAYFALIAASIYTIIGQNGAGDMSDADAQQAFTDTMQGATNMLIGIDTDAEPS